MFRVRKGDTIQIIKGKDKGKKGKVLTIFPDSGRALIEGLNMVKKHKRQTRQDQQGGIVSIEAPISISNLMYFCKNCAKPVRLSFALAKDKSKARVCKSCKGVI